MKLTFGPEGPREPVAIPLPGLTLEGDLDVPAEARALVALGAGPLFEGEAIARVAALAGAWFRSFLGGVRMPTP